MEASTYKDKVIPVLVVFQKLPDQEENIIGQRQRHDQGTDNHYGMKDNAMQSGEEQEWNNGGGPKGFKNRPQAVTCQDESELIFASYFLFEFFCQ